MKRRHSGPPKNLPSVREARAAEGVPPRSSAASSALPHTSQLARALTQSTKASRAEANAAKLERAAAHDPQQPRRRNIIVVVLLLILGGLVVLFTAFPPDPPRTKMGRPPADKPAVAPAPTPTRSIDELKALQTNTRVRTLAESITGYLNLGSGWLIEARGTGDSLELHPWYVEDWQRRAPFPDRGAPTGGVVPTRMGSPLRATVTSGTPPDAPLQWIVRDEVIQVYVGTPRTEQFVRDPKATRCLFLSFGGNDTVSYPTADHFPLSKHDRFFGHDGRTKSIPLADPVLSYVPLPPPDGNAGR